MNGLSTLPTTAEQARHALLLLGAPAPARLVADVHGALFDGDLSVPSLAALLRDPSSGLCAALDHNLSPVRGLVALSDWALERRIVTPAARRADTLAMVIRVNGFMAMRPGRAAHRLLRSLAEEVPHGLEALDLAEAARAALESAELASALAAEEPMRAAAVARSVPHQRGAS